MPRRKQQAPKRAAGKEKPSPDTALSLRSSRSFPPSLLLPRVTLAFPGRSRIYFSPSPSLCPELPVPLRARGPARGSPAPTPSRRPAPAPAKLPPNFPPLSPLLPRPRSPPGSSLLFAPRFISLLLLFYSFFFFGRSFSPRRFVSQTRVAERLGALRLPLRGCAALPERCVCLKRRRGCGAEPGGEVQPLISGGENCNRK